MDLSTQSHCNKPVLNILYQPRVQGFFLTWKRCAKSYIGSLPKLMSHSFCTAIMSYLCPSLPNIIFVLCSSSFLLCHINQRKVLLHLIRFSNHVPGLLLDPLCLSHVACISLRLVLTTLSLPEIAAIQSYADLQPGVQCLKPTGSC